MRLGRETLEVVLHAFVKQLVIGEHLGKLLQLGAGRQLAPDKEMGDLDERRLLSQLFDRDAAIAQNALLAIDESNRTLARTRVAVAVVEGDITGLGPEAGDVDGSLLFGPFKRRQGERFSVQFQFGIFHKSKKVLQPRTGAKLMQ